MALFKSQNMTSASGSVGGVTYTRTRSGMTIRARANPVQPNSSAQLQVRNALTTLVNRWTEVLTAAERAAWDLYAANVPVINPLGDSVFITGQNWYIANNTPRLQADAKISGSALGVVDTAPPIFDRGVLTTPVPSSLSAGSDNVSIAYTNTDGWAIAEGGALLIYMGQPINDSRKFFKGPFRLVGAVAGAATPPTSPATIGSLSTLGYPFATGAFQGVYWKFTATDAYSRLTTPQIVGPITPGA